MKLDGRFGNFGGLFASELLVPALEDLEAKWLHLRQDTSFQIELQSLLETYAGRPTPLYHSEKLSREIGCRVLLKREDLLHGGAHKTNNTIGQGLLAKHMGKKNLIAETGAGQHGVATAMAGALLDMNVLIFMGEKDAARQQPNVQRMQLFGAEVRQVSCGSRSLKDAINEAMRHWTEYVDSCFYVFGTAAGPHPYPSIVRDFQQIIGQEMKTQTHQLSGGLPTAVVACVGGGSNAIGAFAEFIDEPNVRLIGVEPAGKGLDSSAHGATLTRGSPGCLHGSLSYVLQDPDGQIMEAHSLSAGLDYPGIGPEHAHLKETGRAEYLAATDDEAVNAFTWLARHEGIIPALESSHALAALWQLKGQFGPDDDVIINLSGRGDKDLVHVHDYIETRGTA
jgi:tryptophan synthase beta chain